MMLQDYVLNEIISINSLTKTVYNILSNNFSCYDYDTGDINYYDSNSKLCKTLQGSKLEDNEKYGDVLKSDLNIYIYNNNKLYKKIMNGAILTYYLFEYQPQLKSQTNNVIKLENGVKVIQDNSSIDNYIIDENIQLSYDLYKYGYNYLSLGKIQFNDLIITYHYDRIQFIYMNNDEKTEFLLKCYVGQIE